MKGANMSQQKFTDRQVIGKLICVNRMHRTITENKVGQLGIHRSQHHMLMAIGNREGISQKEIAEKMEISPAAVAVTLKKLEVAGFIERSTSADDSRVNNIHLTEKGREITKITSELFGGIDAAMLESFTDEERETLCSLLDKLKGNLKAQFECL